MGVVKLTGDGLGLTPREHAAQLEKILVRSKTPADFYSIGGVVEELESRFARILGKERAIFMPTGTLANHLAVRALSGGRGRVAVQEQSHLYQDSGDCVQTLSGLPLVPLGQGEASFTAESLRRLIEVTRSGRVASRVSVVSIETPVRRASGQMFDEDALKEIIEVAERADIALHLDGARLFLQAAYTGHSVARLAKPFDTVYVSLYKYFNAPSGAILAGPRRLIADMHHARRMFGGGLAQAWPFAAAALHGLDGFAERYGKAVARGEKWLRAIGRRPEFRLERVANGTNLSRLSLAGGRLSVVGSRLSAATFWSRLARRGIELGLPDANGTFTIAVNETLLRKPADELAASFVRALRGR